jgi:hypothetical protein
MRQQSPKARPRPLTRQAYLDELAADVAEARNLGYSDAEIAEALSLDAETAKDLNLGLDALPVTERSVRRGRGGAKKTEESTSLKAKREQDEKTAPKKTGGRGKRAADPTAPKPTSVPAEDDPAGAFAGGAQAPDETAAGTPPDITDVPSASGEPALGADDATGNQSTRAPSHDMEPAVEPASSKSSGTSWRFHGLDMSKAETDKALLRNTAKGVAQSISAKLAQGGTEAEPTAELPF